MEFEQGGEKRAEYGEGLLARLADDLTARFGRGFSRQNLQRFRQFYVSQPAEKICSTLSSKLTGGIRSTPSNELGEATIVQTLSAKSKVAEIRPTPSGISRTPSGKSSPFALSELARAFPLPWSHYILLISRTRSPEAFAFYHTEALRGGLERDTRWKDCQTRFWHANTSSPFQMRSGSPQKSKRPASFWNEEPADDFNPPS